jgi:hypothetical protein
VRRAYLKVDPYCRTFGQCLARDRQIKNDSDGLTEPGLKQFYRLRFYFRHKAEWQPEFRHAKTTVFALPCVERLFSDPET